VIPASMEVIKVQVVNIDLTSVTMALPETPLAQDCEQHTAKRQKLSGDISHRVDIDDSEDDCYSALSASEIPVPMDADDDEHHEQTRPSHLPPSGIDSDGFGEPAEEPSQGAGGGAGGGGGDGAGGDGAGGDGADDGDDDPDDDEFVDFDGEEAPPSPPREPCRGHIVHGQCRNLGGEASCNFSHPEALRGPNAMGRSIAARLARRGTYWCDRADKCKNKTCEYGHKWTPPDGRDADDRRTYMPYSAIWQQLKNTMTTKMCREEEKRQNALDKAQDEAEAEAEAIALAASGAQDEPEDEVEVEDDEVYASQSRSPIPDRDQGW
jgi:hypothetical protein